MTAKEFIDSGMLELYVLGSLSEPEKAEVERMCRQFPEVKEELEAIELSIEAIDQTIGKPPPASSKERLFHALTTASEPMRPVVKAEPVNQKWLVAASISIALFSLAAAIYFYQKYNEADQQYQSLVAQNAMMAQELNQVKNSLDENEQLLAIATDESTRRIELAPTAGSANLEVAVYWNSKTNEVFLDPGNLVLPGDQQDYQLWAIVGGKPVDMGLVDLSDPSSLQKMKPVAGAAAFAITLEPKGGRPEPTLEQMVVLGKVSV